jgi:chemotaxis protein histidine kinase CheA
LPTAARWPRTWRTDADVVQFVRTGVAVAIEQDDRASVGHLADNSPNGGVRLAAVDALQEPYAKVKEFLAGQWYMGKEDDDQIAIAQIMTTGGPGVKAAAQAALQGTADDRAQFLAVGQYKAAEDDDRVAVTQAMATGGPEVQAAAQAALSGPPSFQRKFLQTELLKARERDADTARHVAQIESYLSDAAQTAALARQNAQEAQAAAYRAAGAAAQAQDWANRAVASANQAREYANQAKASADQAQRSADEAASWAKKARQAEQSAQAAAASAARSANQAAASAAQARQYADAAQASAAQARADANAAGKSSAEAAAAAAEAKQIAVEKQKLEDVATRQNDRDHATNGELSDDEQAIFDQGGQAALDEYRKAQADANKTVAQWLVDNGAEILMTLLGVDDIVNCVKTGDVGSCIWALVDVGSFFVAVGKLPAISKAILKVVNGIRKFFDEASKARKVLERTAKIIEDARAAKRPKIEVCELGFAGFAGSGLRAGVTMSRAPAMAAAKRCKVDHIGQVGGDYINKGPHLNMDDLSEVAIGVDKDGNLVGFGINANGKFPSEQHIRTAIDTLMSDQKARTALLKNTEGALDQVKAGRLGIHDENMIKRMKQLCYRLRKLGVEE